MIYIVMVMQLLAVFYLVYQISEKIVPLEEKIEHIRYEIELAANKFELVRTSLFLNDQHLKEHIRDLARIDSRLDILGRQLDKLVGGHDDRAF